MRPLRVLVADPAPLQRSGLRAILGADGGTTQTAGPGPGPGPRPGPAAPDSMPRPALMEAPGRDQAAAPRPGPTAPASAAPGTPAPGIPALDIPAPRTPALNTAASGPAGPGRATPAPPAPATPAAAGSAAAGSATAPESDPAFDRDPAVAEIIVAGEAGDGVEAVELARRLLPDVLVTEIALPRMDGLAVARAVAEARLPVRVLILTDQDTDEEVLAAICAGATGYLCKDAPRDELITAIRTVAAGGAVIAPQLLARLLSRIAKALPAAADNGAAALKALTSREHEVLIHVARGRTNAEIAGLLGVSETTVKTHVGHVLTKLRLRDRTQAVVLAYETGLVTPGV